MVLKTTFMATRRTHHNSDHQRIWFPAAVLLFMYSILHRMCLSGNRVTSSMTTKATIIYTAHEWIGRQFRQCHSYSLKYGSHCWPPCCRYLHIPRNHDQAITCHDIFDGKFIVIRGTGSNTCDIWVMGNDRKFKKNFPLFLKFSVAPGLIHIICNTLYNALLQRVQIM